MRDQRRAQGQTIRVVELGEPRKHPSHDKRVMSITEDDSNEEEYEEEDDEEYDDELDDDESAT